MKCEFTNSPLNFNIIKVCSFEKVIRKKLNNFAIAVYKPVTISVEKNSF